MNLNTKLTSLLSVFIFFSIFYANAQDVTPVPVTISEVSNLEDTDRSYIFQNISVPGVDFLEVTSSNDHGHYAGNTKNSDGKIVGFTLINGEFTTYDVPESTQTAFYGFNNSGQAVGFYNDQNEKSHGVILQNGELKVFDFPTAAQTQPFGITETGQIVGDIFDEDNNIFGFIGDMVFNIPMATATYVDHINSSGIIVGSYEDMNKMYHGFIYQPDGTYQNITVPGILNIEYLFVNAINDDGVVVFRAKAEDDIERSYVLHPNKDPMELRFPGSVVTVLRDIDNNGKVVGYYDLPDGRRQGCLISPVQTLEAEKYSNVFMMDLNKGLNLISLPLETPTPLNAKSLAGMVGSTYVIELDAVRQKFVGWTPNAPNDGFQIDGGKGYIVHVPERRSLIFVGASWTNPFQAAAAPHISSFPTYNNTWAFMVSGTMKGTQDLDGFLVNVKNTRTNTVITTQIEDEYFAAATADLSFKNVVEVGDRIDVMVTNSLGEIASETYSFTVSQQNIENALMSINLEGIGKPKKNALLQNYPNPFNPETWIPYRITENELVSIDIFDATGTLIRQLSHGFKPAGFYQSRERAAYWDGKNSFGESVASGVYFYQLTTTSFQQTRRMIIIK
ncbi:hypothetical protein C6497_03570 [Candidatus Poribacteria bacterium]|nr:MAG: hypothetical protein C6497_03570 [Candidatus Poribacteria bacterium]